MSAQQRFIAHLDMDAFYASVELLRYPQLRGHPVVIGGRRRQAADAASQDREGFARLSAYAGRGVITTATYEARRFGVRSGMGLMKAATLCPQAILLPVDFDEYRRLSRCFKQAVAEIAPVIEDRGIDEIYIDLTGMAGVRDDGGFEIATLIKQTIRQRCGLSCSIGISPNKLLSKIASELDKPDGLTLIRPEDIETRIWPLPASRINGIGPKAAARLQALGIESIRELAAADPGLLVQHFGPSYGHWLHEAAHGRDDRPVITHSEPKSVSRETTFERNLHAQRDRDQLSSLFTTLCERLAEDLLRKAYSGRTVGIKIRFEDFSTVTRDITLPAPVADAASIRAAAGQCLRRVDLSKRLRLLGVRVGSLAGHSDAQAYRVPESRPKPAPPPIASLFDEMPD